MLSSLARKVFGTTNDRIIRHYQNRVLAINALEQKLAALSDEALQAKTQEFRARLTKGETLDKILPEAFATVREASKRVLGMRHFDVQLIGGVVLHEGRIAEMKTGEGKTLVATLPAYLNALQGKGVHVVTVNDYLARRDSGWMGQIYRFLGLTVGVITHELDDGERQEAYGCDITYGTNNEYGFDYLRDNMKYSRDMMVQRPFNFAVVDEVDSILIDEARTPLIISGPTEDNSALYTQVDRLVAKLMQNSADVVEVSNTNTLKSESTFNPLTKQVEQQIWYETDEKSKSTALTEAGVTQIETMLAEAGLMSEGDTLYDIANVSLVHHVNQALRAHVIFSRDVDYIVKDDKVIIIDEFTGRMMEGRRYSDGLHQALEAKEKVSIQNENQTLASITFQNYFRLYPKLSGMTGTAMTEANEFADIYGLEVIEIPPNVPVARMDYHDEIYRTMKEKYDAVVELIRERHALGQPMLVGTVSIERSELLSTLLKKAKIPHNVLNARHHEREAHIIAQAGQPGAVTIATNMAGRGTDIKLGGNAEMLAEEECKGVEDPAKRQKILERIEAEVERDKDVVLKAGGLYVVGTERHESRRIDNQLRGRSGRQGDPGASKFYLSLEDDLMRIFGSERIDGMLQKFGLKEGEAIIHPWMNKAIERAQGKVEARNYDIRKNLLKFDDVMNDQRKAIFEQRIDLMDAEDVKDTTDEMREDVIAALVTTHIPPRSYAEQWDKEGLEKEIFRVFNLELPIIQWAAEEGIADAEIRDRILDATTSQMAAKDEEYGEQLMRMVRKRTLLQTLDYLWKDHLLSLDHLRSGIGLRAYGQRDPLNEYKQEAFSLFEYMLHHLRELTTERLAHLKIRVEAPPQAITEIQPRQKMFESRQDPALAAELDEMGAEYGQPVLSRISAEERNPADPATWGRVGRNEPCPCGSGKKFKHCHGQVT